MNDNDCWGGCGEKAGPCDFCGENGYCCSPDSNMHSGALCPANVQNLIYALPTKGTGSSHRCYTYVTGI